MLLRGAQVARILEGHPGMPRLKNHAQHFAPQVLRFERFIQFQFAVCAPSLILLVACFKGFAVEVVQVGRVVGREQRSSRRLQIPAS